jgi:hypothetical protein
MLSSEEQQNLSGEWKWVVEVVLLAVFYREGAVRSERMREVTDRWLVHLQIFVTGGDMTRLGHRFDGGDQAARASQLLGIGGA